jgi:ATP-dependent Zn protease
MLKYHGRNKPVEDEGLYYKVAEVTAGWSAAALANLMNEAAILTVSVKFVIALLLCYCWCAGCTSSVEDEGLYYKVAEVTAGWSAAALANLMNQAAVLTVSV